MKNRCIADETGKCMNCKICCYVNDWSKEWFKDLWNRQAKKGENNAHK